MPGPGPQPRLHHCFWRRHLLWPLILFVMVVAGVQWTGLDLKLADSLYALQGDQWALKKHFWTSTVLHDAAQTATKAIGVVLLVAAVASHFRTGLAPYRGGLWLLFLTLALGSVVVGLGKTWTHVDCPWDLQRYGGDRPYLPVFEPHPGTREYGHCFPAGHASGGYGMLGLYFFLLRYAPGLRWLGLSAGLGLGLVYGFAQQLRGAHFLSHDLWTLAICWLAALWWYWLLFMRRERAQAGARAGSTVAAS